MLVAHLGLLGLQLSIFGTAAATPADTTLIQHAINLTSSTHSNLTYSGETYNFSLPGTPVSLLFSNFHSLLNQGELDLCIIETYAVIFDKLVAAKGSDGFLPLNGWTTKYGNTVINLEDYYPPTFRLTYRTLASALRAIALFASMHGYVAMNFEVWDSYIGHVGDGELGSIIPPRLDTLKSAAPLGNT